MYGGHGYGWVHIPSKFGKLGGEMAKLRYWRLLEEYAGLRDDGSHTGQWRVTRKGAVFVKSLIKVPKYALIYRGKLQGFGGDEIDIEDALNNKFNYTELMDNAHR
jgi:hypothetical protein